MIKREIQTYSPEETQTIGRKIGEQMPAGAVIALVGDLGSGKTAFVQGLAMGLEVPDEYYITSPTYTLINEYPGRCPLFHVDLYRLEGFADIEDIGLTEILYGEGVTAIEWADRLDMSEMPDEYIAIKFEILKDESRKIHLSTSMDEIERCF